MQIEKYNNFLKNKFNYGFIDGIPKEKIKINPILFDFQKDITLWSLKKGRNAIFADTGLGKTFMQIEWCKNISNFTNEKVIIFAPLTVNSQTIDEGKKLGINISRYDIFDNFKIKICNYENLEKLNPKDYAGIVLDESSILKSIDGKTKRKLIEFAKDIKYRLCCTATPAPNDISEIANHTEFLGIMKREEMLSKWFFNDGKEWRLKGHAVNKFYEWMASWGFFITKPSDLGYDDGNYNLSKLNIEPLYFDFEFKKDGELFQTSLNGITDRIKIRKDTVLEKAEIIKSVLSKSDQQFIIWCGIDLEAKTLHYLFKNESENLHGTDTIDEKIRKINDFKNGKCRILITKPKICGFGMNFQHCHNMIFFGLSDSYESYYQCIRRCYRFGQTKAVNVLITLSGGESEVLNNVLKKEKKAKEISSEVIKNIKNYEIAEVKGTMHERIKYEMETIKTDYYTLMLGDSCERIKEINNNSIDFSIFSPPFASLYTYSNSERDLGNCQNDEEFFIHFKFIIKELLRVTKEGRNVAVHCMNLPTKKMICGYIGIRDFRGDIIRAFTREGFIFHSEVCIDKNPQAAAIRTKAKGLMFKQLKKDSCDSRMGLADYILCFKKKGENKEPIENKEISNDEWIRLAHPIWYEIRESGTLNSIKAKDDEKHMCPLQLEVIENCIKLWSNKGDTIFTPFMGVGSEVYTALKLERKGIGIELKKEYFMQAKKNILKLENQKKQELLFK